MTMTAACTESNNASFKVSSNRLGGKHLIAELYSCQCDSKVLSRAVHIVKPLKQKILEVGLTIVGEAVHEFHDNECNETVIIDVGSNKENFTDAKKQSSGFTVSLLLAESHVCIHTWGEYQSVTLDVYVCNYLQDNSEKAQSVLDFCIDLFQPEACDIKNIERCHAKMCSGTINPDKK